MCPGDGILVTQPSHNRTVEPVIHPIECTWVEVREISVPASQPLIELFCKLIQDQVSHREKTTGGQTPERRGD